MFYKVHDSVLTAENQFTSQQKVTINHKEFIFLFFVNFLVGFAQDVTMHNLHNNGSNLI